MVSSVLLYISNYLAAALINVISRFHVTLRKKRLILDECTKIIFSSPAYLCSQCKVDDTKIKKQPEQYAVKEVQTVDM